MHFLVKYIRYTGDICDRVFLKFYKPLLLIGILLAFTCYTSFSLKNAAAWDGWVIGDWLINFSGGFVRRGLLGEFILFTSSLSGVKANNIVSLLQIIMCLMLCTLIVALLYDRKVGFWYFFWFTYPGFLAFYIFDKAAVGRKEIILITLFAFWVLYLQKKPKFSLILIAAIGVGAVLTTLAHELFAFYTCYFVFVAYLSYEHDFKTVQFSLIIPIASICTLIALLLFSGSLNNPEICDRLLNVGAKKEVCKGILSWKETTAAHAFINFSSNFSLKTLLGFLLIPCVILGPAGLVIYSSNPEKFSHYMAIVMALIIFSLPLFFLAIDWGRWVHIHVSLLLLAFTKILKEDKIGDPFQTDTHISSFAYFFAITFGSIILLTSSFWILRHCCTYAFFEPRLQISF